MRHTLLIDADILIYRVSAALQVSAHWGNDIWTTWANAREGYATVTDQLADFKEHFLPDDMILVFSDKRNFRYDLCPTYKLNRADKPKPIIYRELVDFCFDHYNCARWHNLEADDVLGIMATSKEAYGECTILTKDKDLRGIPAIWCNMSDLNDVRCILPEQANQWHMVQTLAGDPVDGYAGCPGIGVKTAEKLLYGLFTYEEMWPVVHDTYIKKGLSEDEAILNARLARILRNTDYDFRKKEVKLWTPPTITTETV